MVAGRPAALVHALVGVSEDDADFHSLSPIAGGSREQEIPEVPQEASETGRFINDNLSPERGSCYSEICTLITAA